MADRIELLVSEDDTGAPWICGSEDCVKTPRQTFCNGPCLVTTGGSLVQEVRRDIIDATTFGGQPGLLSFDVWLQVAPNREQIIDITSTVDFGLRDQTRDTSVNRFNASQHVHHDLTVPTGYNTHGILVSLIVQGADTTVQTPYRLFIDNVSLVLYYPEGELGPQATGTTLRGHDRASYTQTLGGAATGSSSTTDVTSTAASSSGGESSKLNIGAIIGGSLAGIFVIGVVWILLLGYMKKKNNKQPVQPYQNQPSVLPLASPSPYSADGKFFVPGSPLPQQQYMQQTPDGMPPSQFGQTWVGTPSPPNSATMMQTPQQNLYPAYANPNPVPPSYDAGGLASPASTHSHSFSQNQGGLGRVGSLTSTH